MLFQNHMLILENQLHSEKWRCFRVVHHSGLAAKGKIVKNRTIGYVLY